jgi:hypothetical protein
MSRAARAIVAALLFTSWVAIVGPAPVAGASNEQPTWWALGDSYSSGEGIPGTDAGGFGKDPDGRTCERANGSTTDNKGRAMPSAAKAWPLVAYEDLYGVQAREQNLTLVACTGATTDAFRWQVAQAREWSKIDRPDVISFSFGGNDLGFAGVLGNCIDVPFAPLDRVNLLLGCDHSDKELRQRVEDKMGADRGAIAGALDEAAKTVAPGGHVFVLGYPHLTEESGRWPAVNKVLGKCQRITRRDAGMLRGVNGLVNQRLSQAVEAAGRRHGGVHFHWLDLPSVYETQAGRHSLCSSTGNQWLNGFTVSGTSGDFRTSRSYHPNQNGHDATGHALSTLIREGIGADELKAPAAAVVEKTGPSEYTINFTHPSWGPVRLIIRQFSSDESEPGPASLEVIDEAGEVRFSYQNEFMYSFAPMGTGLYSGGMRGAPPIDAAGHIFLDFNPGRYNGVIVLAPTPDGFNDFETLPPSDGYNTRFYYAETTDPDGDGTYEVQASGNDCEPSCAGGTTTSDLYRWNGSEYAVE